MLPRKYDSEVAPTWQRTVAGTVKRNGPLTHGLRSQNRGSKEWLTPCKVALPASARPAAEHHEDLRATTTGRLSLQEGSLTICAPLHDRRATTGNRSREEQQICHSSSRGPDFPKLKKRQKQGQTELPEPQTLPKRTRRGEIGPCASF